MIEVIGYTVGGLGQPHPTRGHLPTGREEVIVDDSLGLNPGDTLDLGGRKLKVAGTVTDMTVLGGIPDVFVSLPTAQGMFWNGAPLVTAIGITGTPATVPQGMTLLSHAQLRQDLLRPLDKAIRALDLMSLMLWGVAITIVGSVIYLSAMERVRDFAILKATGASNRGLLVSVALQAVIVSLVSAVTALVLSQPLDAIFPIRPIIPMDALWSLPVIAVVVGLLASATGVRRAISVDPALAFAGP